jgi:hypothetical protein
MCYLRACDCRTPILTAITQYFRPKDKPGNLDNLLESEYGSQKLSQACTNVIIPAFDIQRQQPVFFSSWEVLSYYLSF